MKFNFRIQDYQTRAVESVVNVFKGQSNSSGIKYRIDPGRKKVTKDTQRKFALDNSQKVFDDEVMELGFKNNVLEIDKVQILNNINTIQLSNNIRTSDSLVEGQGACSLDIEMETGTGKTYVYIKTMYELNKNYGWSKFIIVVPSIAIREGVKKSFEMTEE
ncbi:MAG: DEAD/DEAH box helicase family protein, partial [Peptoniphilus harei]|nr:DEAD/DEAH box helicase family protein [Peptoniphilus harei]